MGASVSLLLYFLLPPVAALLTIVAVAFCCFTLGLTESLLGWLGEDEHQAAMLHDPRVPRNPSMDAYQGELDATFSLNELGAYYHAKRCTLGDKPLVPDDLDNSHVKFIEGDKFLSKIDLLKTYEANLDGADEEHGNGDKRMITVRATPAKIDDINETLRCLQSTHEDEASLLDELKAQEARYGFGKC
jgi:hypothetical protein